MLEPALMLEQLEQIIHGKNGAEGFKTLLDTDLKIILLKP